MTTTDHIIPRPNKYLSIERMAELNFVEGHAVAWVDYDSRVIQYSGVNGRKETEPAELVDVLPSGVFLIRLEDGLFRARHTEEVVRTDTVTGEVKYLKTYPLRYSRS